MIICHPLKLIFIKTKKVGGTSFEIALSSLCDEDSVITPISPGDEALRQAIGIPGPQNCASPVWRDKGGKEYWQSSGIFFNHISAPRAKKLIPPDVWNSYRKITIWRDPFDVAISRYYWQGGPAIGMNFGEFVDRHRGFLRENAKIAPFTGEAALDDYLRYESIAEHIEELQVPGLRELFQALSAKGNIRPKQGTSVAETYAMFPKAAAIIAEECRDEIDFFGYQNPLFRRLSPTRLTKKGQNSCLSSYFPWQQAGLAAHGLPIS